MLTKKRMSASAKRVFMQLKTLLAICIAAAILLTCGPVAYMGDTGQTILPNAGFESGSPLTDWTIIAGTWGTQFSKAANHKLDGIYSLKINDSSSSNGYGMRSAKVSAQAYATYIGYVGAYAESGVGQLYLEFWDAANNRIGTNISTSSGTGKWDQIRTEGVAPAGTKYVSLLVYGHGTNVGICYYDAARIIRVDEVSPVENPGLEGSADANGEPAGWNAWSGSVMGTDVVISADRAYEGTKSIKTVDNSSSAAYGLRSAPMAAAGGMKYQASTWIYNVSSSRGEIYLEFWQSSVNNASDTRLGTVIASSTATGTWEKVVATGTAPSGTEYITILFYSNSVNIGTSYYDAAEAHQYYDAPPVSFTSQVSGHPRLFFTSSELATIKARKDDTTVNKYGISYAEIWSNIQNAANTYLNETSMVNSLPAYGITVTYPLPPVQPDPLENPPGFTDSRYPYWTWMGSSLQARLETLSYAYRISDDARYGNKAKEYALALAGWDTWNDPTYDNLVSCLDSAYITRGVAEAYDMCYDLLTQAERDKLVKALYEKGIRPLYKDMATKLDNNLYAVRSAALGTAAVVSLGEKAFYDTYLYRAYDYWDWYLDNLNTSRDSEGFLYTSLSLNYIYQAADFLNRVTGNSDAFTHPYTTGSLSRWLVDFLAPNGWGLVNFSDSSIANYFGQSAFILSSRNDGLAGWYVKETKVGKVGGIQAFNYLSENGALVSPADAGLPVASNVNADIGYVSLRTGWEPDSQLLAFYSGPSDLGHNQYDDNSFIYNAAGEWLLTDPGYISFSSNETKTFTTQTVGHNSMLVNGTGQNSKSGGDVTGMFTSSAVDFTVGDATASYGTTPGVTDWKRKIFNMKSDYYLLLDYVALSGSGTPEMLFHGDTAATFTSGGTPLTLGSALPASFTVEKPRASVSVQSLRPSAAARLYTKYTGAEAYGTYGSIKTASPVNAEAFVTLLRPKIHKQGIIEAESMIPAAASGGRRSSENLMMGHNTAYYSGVGASDYVTYNFNVATAGTYNFKVGMMKHSNAPVTTIKLDGTVLQTGVDLYGDVDLYELTFNNLSLTQGTHSISFEITGKNPSSYGYSIALDYVRLLGTSETVHTAQPYAVNTVTSGTVTGLVVTVDSATSDQWLLNPANSATYTTSNLTITCKGAQGVVRKSNTGAYKRYAIIGTLTTGVNLAAGSQTLAQDIGAGSAVGMAEQTDGKWTGTLRMGALGAPKLYVPSVSQVKLDGTVLSAGQYSYSSTAGLLTINSVAAGDHTLEVTP